MKLFGSYTSPFVRHCRIALSQGGFDYKFVEAGYQMSAEQSPTGKVPYFSDGDLTLTDSSSILKYARERAGRDFLRQIEDYETYAMSNTVMDAAINLFLLENDGFGSDQIPYLKRQKARVESGLVALNQRIRPEQGIETDSALRAACFIDWGLFRNRIQIEPHDNLRALLATANQVEEFTATAPPR